ncbi:MAG: molybdopterin-guanine dinucleotide biosynthesis protein B [Promethearchaeota archaeon]
MRVFAISGYSGTGKTTLIESIVNSLVDSGYSVATIKSSIHHPRQDPNTDTQRHLQAGASFALFVRASDECVTFKDRIDPADLSRLLDFDFLIIEGMKSVNIPKFWCVGDTDISGDLPINTQAIVTWSEDTLENRAVPVISAGQVDRLAEIVKTSAVDVSDIE